jgi:molecular chaperone DnaK
VSEEEKTKAEDAIKAVEDAIKGDDPVVIQESIPKLYEAIGPITKVKHEEEEKAKKANEPKADDNVVDVEPVEPAEAV